MIKECVSYFKDYDSSFSLRLYFKIYGDSNSELKNRRTDLVY